MRRLRNISKTNNAHFSQVYLQKNLYKINSHADHWKSFCKIRINSQLQRRKKSNSLGKRYQNNKKMSLKENQWLTLSHIDYQHKWATKANLFLKDYPSKKWSFTMCSNNKTCFHLKSAQNQSPYGDKKMSQIYFTKMLKEGNKSKRWILKTF